jgi:predicted nuclease of predicted toxin-antitoxin system
VKLREFKFLADEDFDPDVVVHLRASGWNVLTANEAKLLGKPDDALLKAAFLGGRVILTHDSDLGALAIVTKVPVIGILYIRPGHIESKFTIETFDVILQNDPDLQPPFILVAHRRGGEVTIRIRQL